MSDIKQGLEIIQAIAGAIKDLKNVPSGELYAQVMNYLTLDQYNKVIDILKNAGVITVNNHLISWNL